MTNFICPVRTLDFDKTEFDKLQRQLALDDSSLDIQKVEAAKDISFDAGGRLQGKYRLNVVGASQFFSELSSGFYSVAKGILSDEHPDIKQSEAVRLVCLLSNRIAAHRYPAIVGCRLIFDSLRSELDGFVGRSYVLVKNSTVMQQFVQSCELIRGFPQFFKAQLSGRDLTATFVVESAISGNSSLRLRNGVVVQNRETSGRAIRAANIVFDSVSKDWAADEFYTNTRVPHVRGRRFRDKMMTMADALAERQPDASNLVLLFEQARTRRLGVRFDDSLRKRIRKQLALRAVHLHVPMQSIDFVLDCMAARHANKPTLFDLYLCCLEVASRARFGNSLPLRQLAYALVVNAEN